MIKPVQLKKRIPMLSVFLACLLSFGNTSCQKDLVEPVKEEEKAPTPPVTAKPQDSVIKYNYLVTNSKELILAAKNAVAGQVIYVADDAKIDMTNLGTITLRGKVTLTSNRGLTKNGKVSQGALIFTKQEDHMPLIRIAGDNARISRIRIIGPDTLTRADEVARLTQLDKQNGTGNKYYYTLKYARGVEVKGNNFEIDNSELAGWSHAAILFPPGSQNGYVHDNYIHHNQRSRLGYGVSLTGVYARIMHNVFNYNRHAITGYGTPGTGYEAAYNTILEVNTSHAFDMHGGVNRQDGTNIAGTIINIHDNTFYNTRTKAFKIMGYVQKSLIIKDNKFVQKEGINSIDLYPGSKIYTISGNQFSVPYQRVTISLKSF